MGKFEICMEENLRGLAKIWDDEEGEINDDRFLT